MLFKTVFINPSVFIEGSMVVFYRIKLTYPISFLLPAFLHPSSERQNSFKKPFNFLIDCVVINLRFFVSLNLLFAVDERPESVHTTSLSIPKSDMTFFSSGAREGCSFRLPGNMEKASGIPSASRT